MDDIERKGVIWNKGGRVIWNKGGRVIWDKTKYGSIFLDSLPEGDGLDVSTVLLEPFGILLAGLHQLPQLVLGNLDTHVAQFLELVVLDAQAVFSLLVPGVVDVLVFGVRVQLHQLVLQVVEVVGGCHLVQDVHLVELVLLAVLDGQSQALKGVVNINEGAGLASSAVQGHGVPEGHLRAESVQHRTVVGVNVHSVDEVDVHVGLGGGDSPHDALVQLRDFEVEELLEVQESDVVEALGHVVDTAGVVGVHDLHRLALTFFSMVAVQFGHAVAFGDIESLQGPIPVNAHGSDVHDVALLIVLHDGDKDVLGGKGVVLVGVVDGLQGFHGVGSCPLLSEVHDHIRFEFPEGLEEFELLGSNVDIAEVDLFAGELLPAGEPLLDGLDGCYARVAVLSIDFAAREVVDNEDVPAQV